MIFSEVMRDILNSIPIGLLEEIRGWEGHSDDSFRDVGEVQFYSLVIGGPLWAGHYLSHQLKHASNYV